MADPLNWGVTLYLIDWLAIIGELGGNTDIGVHAYVENTAGTDKGVKRP